MTLDRMAAGSTLVGSFVLHYEGAGREDDHAFCRGLSTAFCIPAGVAELSSVLDGVALVRQRSPHEM
jgi:hypothetical protein